MTNELIKSIEDLLQLIDDGVLVRDTSKDDDFEYFTNQSLRIVKTLSDIQRNLEIARELALS